MPRQSDLRFTFEPACGARFEVIAFTLEEALCEPFALTLDLASHDPAIDFGAVLDQPALFTLWHGEQPVRHVHGVVACFGQGATGFRRTRYRAVVGPLLARAALRSDWRIFQQLDAPQILAAIVKAQGIARYQQIVTATHLPREYCVQPGETDLAFLQRLGAEEGFYYAFEHTAQAHTLIHGDCLIVHGAIGGGPVIYNPTPGGDQAGPCLWNFTYTEQVRTARQTQRDYTFQHPQYNLEHAPLAAGLDHQGRDYERYGYPGRYKRDEAGKPFSTTRLLGLRRDARTATVEGDDPRLIPGWAFDLDGHPREDMNRGWRPVAMIHEGTQTPSQAEESADATQGTHYRYSATLVADDTEWKPEPARKPRIDGPQIAIVVGPPGEEIYCDEFGRIKLQFPWDRTGQRDEQSSCWVRVAQNWAGATWGHMAIPRIGHEVIVDFLDGDCDQPIVTARTYHGTNLPPYELPRHKTRMTIRSQTHKGKGFNELHFEDEKDQEEIYVHAQKDQNIHVNHDETTFVGNDRSENVGHDETIAIGDNRTESVGNDEQVDIGRNRSHTVGQDAFLTIKRNQSITIGKDRVEEVGNHRIDKTATNHTTNTGGYVEATIEGHDRLTAGQSIERQTQRYELQTGGRIVIQGPGGSITVADDGITIEGISIRFKGPLNQQGGGKAHVLNLRSNPDAGVVSLPSHSEQFRLRHERTGCELAGVFYCAETAEGKRYIGKTDANGLTARIYTDKPDQVVLRWGRHAARYLRQSIKSE